MRAGEVMIYSVMGVGISSAGIGSDGAQSPHVGSTWFLEVSIARE